MSCKNKHKKGKVGKANNAKVLLANTENIDDKTLSVCTIIKIATEYREQGIRCFKN